MDDHMKPEGPRKAEYPADCLSLPLIHHSKSDSNLDNPSTYSSLLASSRSALNSLHNSLPSTPTIRRLSLPDKRTSFFNPATIHHSRAEIFTIAFKKLIVVFLSVHGLISSGSLAFALIRWSRAIKRGERRKLLQVIKDVLLDPSTRRLASFMGWYSALWTISFPELLKLRTNTQSGSESPPSLVDNNGKWKLKVRNFCADWAAAGAGMISGLAILNETHDQRLNLGLNIFCRGVYTLANSRPLFRIPHGDTLLFGISNAQIMSAFILHPETLPRWYWHWIRRVGTLEVAFLDVHRKINLGLPVSKDSLERLVTRTTPRSPKNQVRLEKWLKDPIKFNRPCAPCHFSHPISHSCFKGNSIRTWVAFKSMLPTYAILHLIPSLLFKRKVLMKTPMKFIFSILKKTGSSALFLATFVWVILYSVCIPSKLYELSEGQIVLRSWSWHAIIGFSTCVSLFWEDSRRRGELALYCAPKALNSIWQVLKSKRMVKSIRYSEVILTSLGTGMMMNCFINSPDKMPTLIRGIIDQLIDPHIPASKKKEKQKKT